MGYSLNKSKELYVDGYTFRGSNFAIFIFSKLEVRFRMEPSGFRGTKVPFDDCDHMNQGAAKPI